MGIEQLELTSLFPDDFRRLVRELLSPERQRNIATSIIVRARRSS